MNVSDGEARAGAAADAALRAALRDAMVDAARPGQRALEARALRQWGELHATERPRAGPLIALHTLCQHHPALVGGALLVFGAAAVLLLRSWLAFDAGVDELMQPDVLSLMTMGVL